MMLSRQMTFRFSAVPGMLLFLQFLWYSWFLRTTMLVTNEKLGFLGCHYFLLLQVEEQDALTNIHQSLTMMIETARTSTIS